MIYEATVYNYRSTVNLKTEDTFGTGGVEVSFSWGFQYQVLLYVYSYTVQVTCSKTSKSGTTMATTIS